MERVGVGGVACEYLIGRTGLEFDNYYNLETRRKTKQNNPLLQKAEWLSK